MIALSRAAREPPLVEPMPEQQPAASGRDQHGGCASSAGRRCTAAADDSGTLMADGADTADELAAIFAASFPTSPVVPGDPCKDLLRAHPSWGLSAEGKAARLSSCPMRSFVEQGATRRQRPNVSVVSEVLLWPDRQQGHSLSLLPQPLISPLLREHLLATPPSSTSTGATRGRGECAELAPHFVFEPPLDHGRTCQLVVATSSFGAREPVLDIEPEKADALAQAERREGVRSCWFAFVDEEAFEATTQGRAHPPGWAAPGRAAAPSAPISTTYRRVPWGTWTLIVLPRGMLPFGDSSRNSRIPKFLLHEAFGNASLALYIDAKLRFYSDASTADEQHILNVRNRAAKPPRLWPLVTRALGLGSKKVGLKRRLRPPAWVSPMHPTRLSAYKEARCVAAIGLVKPELVQRQMEAYRARGFPSWRLEDGGPGLIEGHWHLRDLRDAAQARLGCEWLREFAARGHTRDQLSFNYVAWSLGLLMTSRRGKRRCARQQGRWASLEWCVGNRTRFVRPDIMDKLLVLHHSTGRAREALHRPPSDDVKACGGSGTTRRKQRARVNKQMKPVLTMFETLATTRGVGG